MIIEKTEKYTVLQSYASRSENEYEVYDNLENPLGNYVERFDEDNNPEYEVYALITEEFGDITHFELESIDYFDEFADAVNFLVSELVWN